MRVTYDSEAQAVEPVVDTLLVTIDVIESTAQCHCETCTDRLVSWKRVADPYLPTADDVRGILAR